MKTQTEMLPRPADAQTLLRLFTPRLARKPDERMRYLARPFYHRLDAREVTMAGDGHVFVWAWGRVPGFRDYEVPPGGFGYYRLTDVINLPRRSCQEPCPAPQGPWAGNAADTVWLGQTPARLRRADLVRLAVFDTCLLGPGGTWLPRPEPQAFKYVNFTWQYGTLRGGGIVFCGQPGAVAKRRVRLRKRAQLTGV